MNRYKHREAIEDMIRPLDGYRGKLEAQGKSLTDHIKKNRMALKQAEEKFSKQQTSARVSKATMS
jgi:hypothetical protein